MDIHPTGSILKATNRDPACSVEGADVAIADTEAEVPSIGATNRTRPIVADRPYIEERTTAAAAVARHEHFHWRAKSTGGGVGTKATF